MFRHFITVINYKKLIEMQAKQRQTKMPQTKVKSTSGKRFVKRFNRFD